MVVGLSVSLLVGNMLFSSYSIKLLKEYSAKLSEYRKLKEENLELRAKIEKELNLKDLERYALRKGFKPFRWEEFVLILIELSEKDRTKKLRK